MSDAAGRREVRERLRTDAGASHIEMRLPETWLATGQYRVEIRDLGAVRPAAVFALRVR